MEKNIIYYDKLFPVYDNKEILNKLKIDYDSVSYISSPIYAEKITKIIINHCKTNKLIISDCTAGCGGDSISFLNKFKKVYSFEKNLIRYYYLLNNIKQYNLIQKSHIYCSNFMKVLKNIEDHDVIYIDPPWGGKYYYKNKQLKININNISLESYILDFIIDEDKKTKKIPKLMILKLPCNYDLKYLYDNLKKIGKIYLYDLNKMLIIVIEINKEFYKSSSPLLGRSASELTASTASVEFSELL
jgi:16S rRNA G966 N2-methylase RsmD